MAGNIKGIIVEIGGDTSSLQKALSKVNSQSSSLSKELRGINSLLKLDPKNVELLEQKQTVLNKSIETTQDKLNQLKRIKEEADKKMAEGTEISEENYRALQREIINTESKLKKLNLENSKWTTVGKNIEEVGNKLENVGDKIDKVGNKLSTNLTLPIAAVGTAAVATGNEFEAQMSRVQAIAGATTEELEELTNQAMDLGAETSFSASEVAQGMENLASAGFNTNEIMEAMPGLLDLAASSGAELATSSEIAASTIRGFGLEADSASHVADVFAEAAARTNAQTEDMGEAMKYVAPVAKAVGLSLEETAAAIGIMSDAGIKGSQAGTTLRSGLTRIIKPTKQVKDAMETLGVEFYNNDGKMKSLNEIIEELQKSTNGLTDEAKNQALAQIFGTEALSGMLALVNRGPKELNKMTKSFEQCDGAASEMAETMLDNALGSIESLMGSIESAGIAIQKSLSPIIREVAETIQDLVDEFNNLSEEEQLNIIKTAGLVAGIGPLIKILGGVTSTAGKVANGIGTLSQAIGVLKTGAESGNISVNNLASLLKGLTNPATLATLAVAGVSGALIYFATKQTEAQKEAKEFAEEMRQSKASLDEYNASIDETTNANLVQIDSIARLKDELTTLVDENRKVIGKNKDRVSFILNELNNALGTEYKLNGNIIDSYKNLQKEIDGLLEKKRAEIILNGQEEKYTNAIKEQEKAVEDLKTANDNLGDTYENIQKKYSSLTMPGVYHSIDDQKEAARLKNLLDAYDAAEERVKTYTENVKLYEENYEEFMKGNYEAISNTVKTTTEDWCNKSIEEINNSIQEQSKSLNTYKQIYQNTGNDVAKQNIEQAQENIEILANELTERTKRIGTLGQSEIDAWKSLATNSYDVYNEKISQMDPTIKKEIEDATGVIAQQTPNIASMSNSLGLAVIREFDKSDESKKTALKVITSYMNGLSDKDKRQLLKEIGIKNADIVLKELDQEKLSEENGKNILQGLWKGLSNNSLTNKIKNVASGLAEAVNKAFTSKKGWDEHSPSKKMEGYAKNYIKPISTVMKSQENNIVKSARELASKINTVFNKKNGTSYLQNLENIKAQNDIQRINSTKTIFTTPQINFNVQELDEEKLQKCFNYINRKFGSQY